MEVATEHDVLDIMARGARSRATGETRLNERSSRSHQILTVIVDGAAGPAGQRTHGCLHLVDLAGSERVGKSEAVGVAAFVLRRACQHQYSILPLLRCDSR